MTDERFVALPSPVPVVPDTPSNRFMAADIMKKRGFDPIARMIDLAIELEDMDKDLGAPVNAQKRMAVYTTLAKYYAPQPKSVDINVKSDSTFTIQAVSYADLINQNRNMIPEQVGYAGPTLLGATEEVDDAD